jgi:hypothetical protein
MFNSFPFSCTGDVLTGESSREDIDPRRIFELFDVLEDRDVRPMAREDAATVWIALAHPRDLSSCHSFDRKIEASNPGKQRADL